MWLAVQVTLHHWIYTNSFLFFFPSCPLQPKVNTCGSNVAWILSISIFCPGNLNYLINWLYGALCCCLDKVSKMPHSTTNQCDNFFKIKYKSCNIQIILVDRKLNQKGKLCFGDTEQMKPSQLCVLEKSHLQHLF